MSIRTNYLKKSLNFVHYATNNKKNRPGPVEFFRRVQSTAISRIIS
jgi:hypothetical protein